MYKMARYEQCQELEGSRNADLTEPQEVTPSLIVYTYIHNNTPPKGGRVGRQILLRVCVRAILPG